MPHPLFVLNGSNLNLLGRREPELYGTTTLEQIRLRTERLSSELGLACDFRQTNHEGVLVDWIQEAFTRDAALIINPAGFSFGCVPVLDALKLTDIHRWVAAFLKKWVQCLTFRGSEYRWQSVSRHICTVLLGIYQIKHPCVAQFRASQFLRPKPANLSDN